ncbi:vWA domain-containing protein [Roseibacillus persicicus]|uniref:vWA domain-containing protein n=1 Tax=Roseibacillus persicicus TaxID=454148 RepID=UPI00280C8ED1|nr:VWA domain-containing protein [Roseibacillus persicicus]MDQ8189938.1 VWA domain-containing protein [Roseibacillus persicicus]
MLLAHPFVLLLLAIPIGLLVFQYRHKGQAVALPSDHHPHKRRRLLTFLLDFAGTLPAFLLALAIVLLAGPRKFEQPRSEREMTNIQFCIDVSGSMTAPFGDGDRFDAAMEAVNSFIDYRKGDSFGLTIFGNSFMHWVPLTTDVSAFRCAPPFLHPTKLPSWFGGTEIGKAVRACEDVLVSREEGDRMILLITDGQSFDLSNGKDVEIANSLKDNGIVLYGVHVADGGPPPEVSVMASITGGQYFSAGDPAALDAVFKQIDTMKQSRIKRLTPDPVDNFTPFIFASFAVAGLHLLTLFGLRYNPW